MVLSLSEPSYIQQGGRNLPLLKSILPKKDFDILKNEAIKVFENSDGMIFMGHHLISRLSKSEMEFRVSVSLPANSPTTNRTQTEKTDNVHQSNGIDLEELLRLMVDKSSSDLHISAGSKPVMRIHGDMEILSEYPIVDESMIINQLKKITPDRNYKEFSEISDTDFAHEIPGVARFRANIFRDRNGVGAVFRVIPTNILTVIDLKIPQSVVDLCEIPKGLILVTGPTGSGKSTTLSALIDHINKTQKKHIITVEDPVEFVHPNKLSLINQREVHTHTHSFKTALRAALREDPDVIMVGELRDHETIAIALEMAVTGHLVFGTLHTATAIGTIDRIIDQFPSNQQSQIRTMLADAIIGVISQTLLKKRGGRIGAYEVLIATMALSNLIREAKTFQIASLMQTGKSIGMQTINSHLFELVNDGIVESEEAIAKAVDKANLKDMLQRIKNPGDDGGRTAGH